MLQLIPRYPAFSAPKPLASDTELAVVTNFGRQKPIYVPQMMFYEIFHRKLFYKTSCIWSRELTDDVPTSSGTRSQGFEGF